MTLPDKKVADNYQSNLCHLPGFNFLHVLLTLCLLALSLTSFPYLLSGFLDTCVGISKVSSYCKHLHVVVFSWNLKCLVLWQRYLLLLDPLFVSP